MTENTPKNCIVWLLIAQAVLIQLSRLSNGLLAKNNSSCHHYGELKCPRAAEQRAAQSMDQVRCSSHSLHRPFETCIVWWLRSCKCSLRGRFRKIETWYGKDIEQVNEGLSSLLQGQTPKHQRLCISTTKAFEHPGIKNGVDQCSNCRSWLSTHTPSVSPSRLFMHSAWLLRTHWWALRKLDTYFQRMRWERQ